MTPTPLKPCKPTVLILDEAVSSLDDANAEQFCRTLNELKGSVTMLFITHMLPKSLHVDGIIRIGSTPSGTHHLEATQGGAP